LALNIRENQARYFFYDKLNMTFSWKIRSEKIMPFHRPFYSDVKPGDLVYGLSGPRQRWFIARNINPKGYTIDDFGGTRSDVIFTQANYGLPPDQKAYTEYLKTHPRYSRINRIYRHRRNDETPEDFRTKCKAGLAWTTDPTRTNSAIHFILDELNMQEVIEKRENNFYTPPIRSITGSELRWIFRNRHMPLVQKTIQFWLHGQMVIPPWEYDRNAWRAYNPTTTHYPPSAHAVGLNSKRSTLARFFCLA
jgi:hypothetical protein